MKTSVIRIIGIVVAILVACMPLLSARINPFHPIPASANGFIDFEGGIDRQPIQSTIPGLEFTTTDGQDWIFGDWRTGGYSGKYPNGVYTSNGNFFAWLGENQGDGQITFTQGGATYLSIGVSTAETVYLRGYSETGTLLATATMGSNINTGVMNLLRIETTADRKFSYAIVSGTANYWLIDDLATDASGVPNAKTPLIFIPGIMGTSLNNHEGEVWPNTNELIWDNDDDSLRVLRLGPDGVLPLQPQNQDYNTVGVGNVIRDAGTDVYGSMIDYLGTRGYSTHSNTLYLYPYDWRKDNRTSADGLSTLIDSIKAETGADKVNILAHSMGGLVARLYISDPGRAANVDTLVTLGTPYLGAPKSFDVLHFGHECMVSFGPICFLNRETTRDMILNMPGAYQLLPGPNYHKVYPNGHLNIDRDTDNNGQNEGWQDFAAVKTLIQQTYNSTIFGWAEDVFSTVESYANGTNGVKVYVFVGMKQNTPGEVREFLRTGRYGVRYIAYDLVPTNGDGTVPLHSADLGRTLGPNDFSGSVSYYYARLEHGALAKYEKDGIALLQLVADILEVDAPVVTGYERSRVFEQETLALGHSDSDFAQLDESRTEMLDSPIMDDPEPLAGYQIVVEGSALLTITDMEGNISQVTAEDVLENQIPGGSVYRIGSTISIFVPENARYHVEATGRTGDEQVDLRIRVISQDEITETIFYGDVPLTGQSTAVMTYDPASATPPDLAIDTDGNGTTDRIHPPDSVLNQIESMDVTPPQSDIIVSYHPGDFLATIAVVASDNEGGSGIGRIEYSLDGLESMQEYVEPILVDYRSLSAIWVKAVDRAGNEQYPLTTAPVGHRVFLPGVQSQTTVPVSALQNGDFEQGSNSGWTEYSVQGWQIILNGGFPGGVTPRSGQWAAWLGGDDNEIALVEQTVSVPTSAPVLTYWTWIGSNEQGCNYDFGGIIVNSSVIVEQYGLCEATNTDGWERRVVDLSAYAGQTIAVQIRAETDSSINSNLFVDDVAFMATAALESSPEHGIAQSRAAAAEDKGNSGIDQSLRSGNDFLPVWVHKEK